MILVRFHGVKDGDPKELKLEHIPRQFEEIVLDNGRVYEVNEVRWQLTTAGLREVCLELKANEDVKV